jgi:hypothetical protein
VTPSWTIGRLLSFGIGQPHRLPPLHHRWPDLCQEKGVNTWPPISEQNIFAVKFVSSHDCLSASARTRTVFKFSIASRIGGASNTVFTRKWLNYKSQSVAALLLHGHLPVPEYSLSSRTDPISHDRLLANHLLQRIFQHFRRRQSSPPTKEN